MLELETWFGYGCVYRIHHVISNIFHFRWVTGQQRSSRVFVRVAANECPSKCFSLHVQQFCTTHSHPVEKLTDFFTWSLESIKIHFRLNTRTRRHCSLAIREWVCHEWNWRATRLWSILAAFLETIHWGPRLRTNLRCTREFQLHLACLVVGIAKHVRT